MFSIYDLIAKGYYVLGKRGWAHTSVIVAAIVVRHMRPGTIVSIVESHFNRNLLVVSQF